MRRNAASYPILVAVGIMAALLVPQIGRFLATESEARLAVALTLTVVAASLFAFAMSRLVSQDWFHPLAFPTAYVAFVLLGPVLYLMWAGLPLTSADATDVSFRLILTFSLTVIGLALGARVAMFATPSSTTESRRPIKYTRLLRVGRGLVVVAIVLRALELPGALVQPYGFGSVEYGLETSLRIMANGLIFVAVALIVTANSQLSRSVLKPVDVALFLGFAGMTLVTGSRGELVAPALFALWAHHAYIRRMRIWRGLVFGAVVVIAFSIVGHSRADRSLALPDRSSLGQRVLEPVSTPVFITSTVIQEVPVNHPYMYGKTYIEALKRQLPGPVSHWVFGPPRDTGTFVFRRIMGFQNPNAGFAFSLPSESYLNFGIVGAPIVALLIGLLFGFAYRRQANPPTRALHILYPILVATLPLSLRSDAVLQIKAVLYPMIILALVFRFSRARIRYSLPRPTGMEWIPSSTSVPEATVIARSGNEGIGDRRQALPRRNPRPLA